MAVFKGENSTISLLEESNGWGKAPSTYAGGRMFQNNDGTLNASRNTLQSEARTPNAELAGLRLGTRNVTGSFPVEIDPENYNQLLESVFYGRFVKAGTSQSITGVELTASKVYEIDVTLTASEITGLAVNVGDMVNIKDISLTEHVGLETVSVVISKTATSLKLYCAEQREATLATGSMDFVIDPVEVLRPAKKVRSFNAEETMYSEDGLSETRFMSTGVVATSAAFEMPSDGTIKCTFSLLAASKMASKLYENFDSNLTNQQAAHTSPVAHKKYDPMVLQDGQMITGENNTLCQLISGNLSIENGTEVHFTGCSFDAKGAVSGKFMVNLNYEALFESEDDYIAFDNEELNKVLIKLKDRTTNRSLVMYLPAVRTTAYNINNAQGLITASLTAQAIIDPEAVNSLVLGAVYG